MLAPSLTHPPFLGRLPESISLNHVDKVCYGFQIV